jgi:hypothetical protein
MHDVLDRLLIETEFGVAAPQFGEAILAPALSTAAASAIRSTRPSTRNVFGLSLGFPNSSRRM